MTVQLLRRSGLSGPVDASHVTQAPGRQVLASQAPLTIEDRVAWFRAFGVQVASAYLSGSADEGICCQTPMMLPAGSLKRATHRSPSVYRGCTTVPP